MALTKATNSMISNSQINIKDFESLSEGGTNWQPAIQAAIDSLDTGGDTTTGGVINFPVGKYKIRRPIVIRGGAFGLTSITLQGEGMHNTVIDCASDFVGDQAIQILTATYCAFKDFHVLANSRADYCMDFVAGSELKIERVFCQNAIESCFYFRRCFMVTMDQCRAKGGRTQFDFSGDYNTSLNVMNCYALRSPDNPGIGQGYLIRDVSYSTFTSCGADYTGRYGYRVSNTNGVTFNSCGVEQLGRSAWFFEASEALDDLYLLTGTHCTLNDCWSTGADKSVEGYGTLYSNVASGDSTPSNIDVEVNRFYELNSYSSLAVVSGGSDEKHKVSLYDCRFKSGSSITSTVATKDPVATTRVTDLSVTALTTVADLKSIFGSTNNYSGIINILASNGVATGLSSYNAAAYVLLVTKGAGSASIVEIAKNGLTVGTQPSWPSFTWTLDPVTNELQATPVASTSGVFDFYIGQLGTLSAS